VTTAEPQWLPFRIHAGRSVPADEREIHLAELRQLTFNGTAGAATWSPDGKRLLFEATQPGTSCSRIDSLDLATGRVEQLPPGRGWAMSAVFGPAQSNQLLFAFTGAPGPQCVTPAERFRSERWALPNCDIYALDLSSGDLEPVISSPAYDAEVAATRDGSRIVLTSSRTGDPELYVARSDGGDVVRITDTAGYDGSAAFSPDGTRLVWLTERLESDEIEDFRERLNRNVLEPAKLSLVVAGHRGQHPVMLVDDGNHNITPAFFPDSRRIIFASNRDDDQRQPNSNFELYAVDLEGPVTVTGGPALRRLTFRDGFDGAPAWSPDGKYLAFTSSRLAQKPGQTNLFVARWVED
jgi:Tol biopolymer transport system component